MTQSNARVVLKSMREKSVKNRRPRLFAGAIKDVEGKPKDGDPKDGSGKPKDGSGKPGDPKIQDAITLQLK